MAVVTTSSSCLRVSSNGSKFLRATDYQRNPQDVLNEFNEMITPGEFGNPKERGILMATEALTEKAVGDSWIRQAAEKAVLIVSDGVVAPVTRLLMNLTLGLITSESAPSGTEFWTLSFQKIVRCALIQAAMNSYPSEYERLVSLSGGFADESIKPTITSTFKTSD